MFSHLTKTRTCCACLILFFLLCGGCSSTDKSIAKEKIESKRKNYEALSAALSDKTLKKGASRSDIIELYGEPDDIFRSGSSVSSFEMWSYEKVDAEGNTDLWNPIRLYFENDKLINWKY